MHSFPDERSIATVTIASSSKICVSSLADQVRRLSSDDRRTLAAEGQRLFRKKLEMIQRRSYIARSRKPIPRVSRKKRIADAELRKNAAIRHKIAHGRCEIDLDGCLKFGRDPHHLKLRSQGGTNEVENLRNCCRACHDWIHGHVSEARERGWIISGKA